MSANEDGSIAFSNPALKLATIHRKRNGSLAGRDKGEQQFVELLRPIALQAAPGTEDSATLAEGDSGKRDSRFLLSADDRNGARVEFDSVPVLYVVVAIARIPLVELPAEPDLGMNIEMQIFGALEIRDEPVLPAGRDKASMVHAANPATFRGYAAEPAIVFPRHQEIQILVTSQSRRRVARTFEHAVANSGAVQLFKECSSGAENGLRRKFPVFHWPCLPDCSVRCSAVFFAIVLCYHDSI